jgi:aminomethyltransferase
VADTQTLKRTPLHDLHLRLGGKMVEFAGYDMPVQYAPGVLKEHLHTRTSAGLFDVSHMGQVRVMGDDPAAALESLVVGDLQSLAPGEMRYTLFTNEAGGILDDLMVTNAGDHLFVVVNAACKAQDIALMQRGLDGKATVEPLPDRALIAVQGPKAAEAVGKLTPKTADLYFMQGSAMPVNGIDCFVTRSGYTGEDGFEISAPAGDAEAIARTLLDDPEVGPIGLGARDSLRLEAGLCLYGHDIDETTSPVEAALLWTIAKRRREDGGFPGADVIRGQIANGVARKRVGLRPEGKAPAREGTEIANADERIIGNVTSGGFGPSVGGPVAMGYVETQFAKVDTAVNLMVRGTARPAAVARMPFVAPGYRRPD